MTASTLRRAAAAVAMAALLVGCGASTDVVSEAGSASSDEIVTAPTATPRLEATPTPAPTPTPALTPTTAPTPEPTPTPTPQPFQTGADVLAATGFEQLVGKRVGIIVNRTSVLADGTHLIDALDDHPQVELVRIFAPEHGVRGVVDAGELVDDTVDVETGIAVRSLYGSQRTPAAADLGDLDVLIYDLQDAGTRFYTFVSTMGLAMEAADAAAVEFMVLDRPNPLGGDLVAGFDRTPDQTSFISQYPIPAVYGMTAGELARMIAAEGWVGDRPLPEPTVIAMANWDRGQWPSDRDWIAPSPGLPTIDATRAYPGTVFLEATTLSYGKGTTVPFSMVGGPQLAADALAAELNNRGLPGVAFDPIVVTPDSAIAPNPRFDGQQIGAVLLTVTDPSTYQPVATGVHLLTALRDQLGTTAFIDRAPTFDLLAGTTQLRIMLDSGAPAADIIAAWQAEAAAFADRRQPYLLY